jgi:hypothetical protein
MKKFTIAAVLLFATACLFSCSKNSSSSPPTNTTQPAPIASYTYTWAGASPALVTFTNTSINATSYEWTFGDGTNSYLTSPTHIYTTGTYTATLVANSTYGYSTVSQTFTIPSTSVVYTVGEHYGGGVIFYIDATGQHGLIASTSDLSSTSWGCSSANVPNADGTAIGTGSANTTAILASCNTVGTAAYECKNLSLNGYNDWYLPSAGELNALYFNNSVGMSGNYWSSSNYLNNLAIVYDFQATDSETHNDKNGINKVRPIRSF